MNYRHTTAFAFGLVLARWRKLVRGGDYQWRFRTGDLTGWTASAIDELGDPIDPADFISVQNNAGNNFVQFRTGEFDDGLFVATLEQTFAVAAEEPVLRFDFALVDITPDPTSTGTSPFLDTFVVSVDNGSDSFELMLLD